MKIVTDELTPKTVITYHLTKAQNKDIDLIPKTKRGALDMIDKLYDLRVSLAVNRTNMTEDEHGDCCSILTMIETDIRDWLEKSIS